MTKIKEQRIEEERKKLALQVLTHEFRTPISSLILEVESIKKSFSLLTPALQESFMRVSGDVFRLQRLTEKSRNYLKFQRPKKQVDFNVMKMSSFNEWFSFIIDHYKGDVEFSPLVKDTDAKLDPYWVEISVKNLIENALAHGKSPISVTLTKENKLINITVSDQGICQFDSLDEMCREFTKGKNSSGSGLGLNIVRKVIKEMGGDLKFRKNPTRFILEIPYEDKEVKNV
jgi:signal transduction histidine kinase